MLSPSRAIPALLPIVQRSSRDARKSCSKRARRAPSPTRASRPPAADVDARPRVPPDRGGYARDPIDLYRTNTEALPAAQRHPQSVICEGQRDERAAPVADSRHQWLPSWSDRNPATLRLYGVYLAGPCTGCYCWPQWRGSSTSNPASSARYGDFGPSDVIACSADAGRSDSLAAWRRS